MSMYAIIQEGHCIWGRGETIESCICDANEWLGHYGIRKFESHDNNGSSQGGLTDWTRGRRYQVAGGDLFITDDQSIIDDYEVKNTFPPNSKNSREDRMGMEELTAKEKVLVRMVLKQAIDRMEKKAMEIAHSDNSSANAQAVMAEDLEKAMYKILPRDTQLSVDLPYIGNLLHNSGVATWRGNER